MLAFWLGAQIILVCTSGFPLMASERIETDEVNHLIQLKVTGPYVNVYVIFSFNATENGA